MVRLSMTIGVNAKLITDLNSKLSHLYQTGQYLKLPLFQITLQPIKRILHIFLSLQLIHSHIDCRPLNLPLYLHYPVVIAPYKVSAVIIFAFCHYCGLNALLVIVVYFLTTEQDCLMCVCDVRLLEV